jgi:alkaline phosphatase D
VGHNVGMMKRREFLLAMGALPIVVNCGPAGPQNGNDNGGTSSGPGPEPDPWQAPGTEDLDAFAWGLQVGDARPDRVLLSLRASENEVDLRIMRGVEDGWEEVASVDGVALAIGSAQVELDGLAPDTTYSVAAYTPDGGRRSPVARFRTAPAEDQSRVIRFGASSCFGGNEPWSTLSHAAAEKLDFFLLLGDTIYADNTPDAELDAHWGRALATPGLRDLTSSTSIVSTWDDHEVGNNWSFATPGIEERVVLAREAFHRALPIADGLGEHNIYRKLSWGKALDLFVLDSRGERRNGNYISADQMSWFKDALSQSTARFKVVLNSVPVTDLAALVGDVEADDRWQGYPAQRDEILGHIADAGITGVIWLSGDFHIGAMGKVDPTGGVAAEQWEILCGPTGSPINPFSSYINANEQVVQLIKEHNATLFEANPDTGEIHVRFINDAGDVIHEQTITA